jgi:spermidine synthase
MSFELAQFLRSIHQSLRAVFPEVAAIPGETVHFFAARQAGTLAAGADQLLARLHARHLATSYVSEYFIPFRMAADRMAELHAQLDAPGAAVSPVNRDFAPVAYYFDVVLWSSQFNQGYRRLFRTLAGVSFGALLVTLGAVLLALAATGRLLTEKRHRQRLAASCCTAATGFTMIALEMMLLLAFQALYGYVYQQLALLIAAFMAGMAVGSWLALRPAARGGMRALAVTQVLAAAAPLVLVGLFQAINRTSSPAASQIAFPVLALLSGMLGGFEFPVAAGIFFDGACTAKGLGTLYALDLAGSCIGAILFSAWLIPVFGFLKTALLSTMVSLAAAVIAVPQPGARRTPGQ